MCIRDSGEPVARYEGYGEGDEARFDENGEPIYGKVARPLDEVLLDLSLIHI